ncbi:TatD family hydrolase, partial [Thermodesulfobacteriota bacterium]
LARAFPDVVRPCAGYHPWNVSAESADEEIRWVAEHLDSSVALGEVGLDYKIKVAKQLQREVYSRLLELAVVRDKPVIIHSRASQERTLELTRTAGVRKAVFHWYSGSTETLRKILDAGYLISATPALAYSTPHRQAVRYAPVDRLLLETDAPVSYQGVPSVPEDVWKTLRYAASLKEMDEEILAEAVTRNSTEFFGLDV